MLFKIYLNGGYVATGEYPSAYKARRAFANLFKLHIRNFTADEIVLKNKSEDSNAMQGV